MKIHQSAPVPMPRIGGGTNVNPDPAAGSGARAIGEVLEGVGRFAEHVVRARDRQASNRAEVELAGQFENWMLDNPDGDEEAFLHFSQEQSARLAEGLRTPTLRDEFSTRAKEIEQRGQIKLKHARIQRDISEARANLQEFVSGAAGQIARADTELEADELRARLDVELDQAVADRIITHEQRETLKNTAQQEEASALATLLQREDPELGLEMLKAREGAFEHVAESDRQKLITTFEREIDMLESAAVSRQKELLTIAEKQRKLARDQANAELLTFGENVTVEQVRERRHLLSREEWQAWLKIAEEKTALAADPEYMREMMSLAVNKPEEFSATALDATKLGPRNYPKFIDLQKQVVEFGSVDLVTQEFKGLVDQRVKGMSQSVAAQYEMRAIERLEAFVVRNGHQPTYEESLSILGSLSVTVNTSRVPFFDPQVHQIARSQVPQVEQGIMEWLEDQGQLPTDESVDRIYEELSNDATANGMGTSPEELLLILDEMRKGTQ